MFTADGDDSVLRILEDTVRSPRMSSTWRIDQQSSRNFRLSPGAYGLFFLRPYHR